MQKKAERTGTQSAPGPSRNVATKSPRGYLNTTTTQAENQGSLGNTTNTVYINRYRLLKNVKTLLAGTNHRVLNCMTALGSYVTVNKTADHYHFGNIKQCGNIWICPVCASRVSAQRSQALIGAMQRTNLHPVLVTFTLSHHANDRLTMLLDLLNSTLKRLKQTRHWKTFLDQFNVACFISSLEITYSRANGYHPHKHLLFFTREQIDPALFEAELIKQYIAILSDFGGYASKFYGVKVQADAENAGSYISKVCYEVTGNPSKNPATDHLTFWQIVDLAVKEPWARKVFNQFVLATAGKRAITYSKDAKIILGIDLDADEPEQTPETVQIATIDYDTWKLVLSDGSPDIVLNLAKVGADAMHHYLKSLRSSPRAPSP